MHRAEEIFRRAPFVTDLGIRLESAEPGVCVTGLPISRRHLQQDGFIHAAVQAAMADHTSGAAAVTLVEENQTVLTIEYKINLLRAAQGQALRCRARVLRPGRTISVAEAEVWTIDAGNTQKLTAKATVTMAVVDQNEQRERAADHAPLLVDTREGYDRWSQIYDGEDNALVLLEEPLVDGFIGEVAGLEVLDVGCGTGRHALRLAARGARVTGVDFSRGMLAKAKAKADARGELKLTFVEHDVTKSLPFVDGSFDRVLSALVVDHIRDLGAFFRELGRVVKKSGTVVVTVMHPAMMLRGVQARFIDPSSGKTTHVESAPNQMADYVNAASSANLTIERLEEHAVGEELAARSPRSRKYLGWPMLVALCMRPR
jgi:malonyl-CoA O-methyltransferase